MPLIEVGKAAPLFTLPDQNGDSHALRDSRGGPTVLFFYPKDDTSGCTQEACEFQELLPRTKRSKATLFGISPDGVESHAKFAKKHGLKFTLLADTPTRPRGGGDDAPVVCTKYGVWQEKSMYGKTYMGVVRTTYLLDARGRVAQRWDKVKVPGHAAEVLEAIKALR